MTTSEFKLKAEEKTEKPNRVRANGQIPAVVYGKNFEPISIAVDKIEFERIFRHAGTSHLIDMNANEKKFKTLVHNIQFDPITHNILHVDFLKINMKEKIHAEIPIKFVGESSAVIDRDGSLINPVDTIEIECLPADLPAEFEVDIAILDDFEKNVKVSDLKVPEGVEVLTDPEEVIVFVQEPRSEEELAELETEVVENVDAVEVENKGEEAPAEGEEKTEEKKAE